MSTQFATNDFWVSSNTDAWTPVQSTDWSGVPQVPETKTKGPKSVAKSSAQLPPPHNPSTFFFEISSSVSPKPDSWDAYVVPPTDTELKSLPNDANSSKKTKLNPCVPEEQTDLWVPSQFEDPEECLSTLPQRNVDIETELSKQNLYKTELCRSWMETGVCPYGVKCQFAHGKDELRPVKRHPKYKTEICRTFHTTGTCPYGKRCRFVHHASEQRLNLPPNLPDTPVEPEEQENLERHLAELKLSLLAPDPVFSPPSPVDNKPPKKGSRLPFFQKLRKQKH